jgi:inhibitor of cysteine peptidase
MFRSKSHSIKPMLPFAGWLLLGSLILVQAGCAGNAVNTGVGPQTIRLDPAGGQVSTHPGDTLELTLEANPSTGYIWEVRPLDPALLKLAGEPETKSGSGQPVGAPVTQTFRFQVLAAGQADLTLVYHRPWEKGVAPEKTFSARVTITE